MGLGKEFIKYVLPSMTTFALIGIYAIVDGLFVGNCVGDAGLAGINIAYPVYTLVSALGLGIGIGGSVIYSIRVGAQDFLGAQSVVGTIVVMLLVVSVLAAVLLSVCIVPLCTFLGGSGEALRYAVDYSRVIALAAPVQIFSTGLLPLVRNKGFVKFAMLISMMAGVMNMGLDYVFVYLLDGGTAGAATATVCAQCSTFLGCVGFFLRSNQRIALRDLAPVFDDVVHIFKLGAAPFGMAMMPTITIAVINIQAMAYGGVQAVAAYGIITYVAYIVQVLIQAIGDGAQPLISRYKGAGDNRAVKTLRLMNFSAAITMGFVGLGAMSVFNESIPRLFGISAEAISVAAYALPIFAFAYVFYGFVHASITYFYAIDRASFAAAVVVAEACLVVCSVTGFASMFGVDGIWWAMVFVQVMLMVLSGTFLWRTSKMVC